MSRERPNETMKVDENLIFNGDSLMFDLDAEVTTAINNILKNTFTRVTLSQFDHLLILSKTTYIKFIYDAFKYKEFNPVEFINKIKTLHKNAPITLKQKTTNLRKIKRNLQSEDRFKLETYVSTFQICQNVDSTIDNCVTFTKIPQCFSQAALNVYNTIRKISMNEEIFRKFVSRLTKTKIPKIFGFPLVPQFLKRDLVGSNAVKIPVVLLKVTFDKDF
uniref:ODV-E27 n=1 Tax=Strongyloides venezuelensis TaxID=75913 RepID=A0A0K0FT77_STRVS